MELYCHVLQSYLKMVQVILYLHVCIYIYLHAHIHICIHIYIYAKTYIYIYIYVYIYTYVYSYACVTRNQGSLFTAGADSPSPANANFDGKAGQGSFGNLQNVSCPFVCLLNLVWESVLFPIITIEGFYPISQTSFRRLDKGKVDNRLQHSE